MALAVLGAVLGLLLVAFGFWLPFGPWGVDPDAEVKGQLRLAGSLENWRKYAWFVMLVAGTLFGGLALMFASLQLLRSEERSNQTMRRTVYGFNALLGTVLLIAVLGLLNLLAYTDPIDRVTGRALTREYDWTKTGIYTLSPRTKTFLEGLQEPVKVIYFAGLGEASYTEVVMLLRNCESANKELFKWEVIGISPESRTRTRELMQKYTIPDPIGGLLVLVGDESGKHAHEFIAADKLGRQDFNPMTRRPGKFTFTGENALLGTLTSLTQGQITIYFTQGHGEPSLTAAPPMGGMPRNPGLGTLQQRLQANRTRFEVKPLKLDASLTKIPDDATTVVIVGPTQPFGEHEVKVLREYLERKPEVNPDQSVKIASGRLMALLGPIVSRAGGGTRIQSTGLEELLGTYGVRLEQERIQMMLDSNPLRIEAIINPGSENPLNLAFNDLPRAFTTFTFEDVRVVRPVAEAREDIFSEPLLLAAQEGIWAEKDLSRDPLATAKAMRTDAALRKQLAREPLPLGVAVNLQTGPPPQPGLPPDAGTGRQRPLMLVVGSSSWVSDEGLRGPAGDLRFDLFSSALSWLREQSDLGKLVEDKIAPEYELRASPPENVGRLGLLPLVLMLITVVSLGVGVWVVRRR
jgi:hypothetical protein